MITFNIFQIILWLFISFMIGYVFTSKKTEEVYSIIKSPEEDASGAAKAAQKSEYIKSLGGGH